MPAGYRAEDLVSTSGAPGARFSTRYSGTSTSVFAWNADGCHLTTPCV
jgi:hypothetical protein